jgi:hypothetical protein
MFSGPIHCVMTGANGFCIWNTTGFGEDYLVTPHANGSEAIFYPGEKFGIDGPIPSIRLKVLRNYMQFADLMMTVEGTQYESTGEKARVQAIVNKHLGVSGSKDWWKGKPEFINTPPRTWDFGQAVGDCALVLPSAGKSPKIIEQIINEVVAVLSES